jgi:hypothetical protein
MATEAGTGGTAREERSGREMVGLFSVSLILGAVAFVVTWTTGGESVRLVDQALVGLMTVLISTIVEMLWVVMGVKGAYQRHVDFWEIHHRVDKGVGNIRRLVHAVRRKEGDDCPVLIRYYEEVLESLREKLEHSESTLSVTLDSHHIASADVLLGVFQDRRHTEFCATTCVYGGGADLGSMFEEYFQGWCDHLKERRVTSFRRLFVYEEDDELRDPCVEMLGSWHNGMRKQRSGVEAKVVPKSEMEKILAAHEVETARLDIGVYSALAVYSATHGASGLPRGTLHCDRETVKKYKRAFDGVWRSSKARPIEEIVTVEMTEERVFDAALVLSRKVRT